MKRFVLCTLGLAIAFSALAGCGGKKVAARVNKDNITEDEFYQRVKDVDVAQLAPALQGQGPSRAGEYAMQNLIYEKLMLQFADTKKVTVSDADVNAYVEFAKKYPQDPMVTWIAPDPFRTEDDWKRDGRIALLTRKMAFAPLKITDKEIQNIYESKKAALTPPDKYHLRVIIVRSVAKAELCLASLKKGVAFETVALKESEDQTTRSKSGDVGMIPAKVNNPILQPTVDAARKLKPGEYTTSPVKVKISEPNGQSLTAYTLAQLVDIAPGVTPRLETVRWICEVEVASAKDPGAFQRVQTDIREFKDKADIQINMKPYQDLMKKK